MKKLFNLIFLSLSLCVFSQSGIKFEQNGSLNDYLEKAKASNKLVFLDAFASWCGPCKLMDKNIFSLPTVGDFYNEHFINAKIDMEKGEGREIAKKYQVKAYPSYLFLNGNGEVVHKVLGYVEEGDFIQAGKDALDPSKNITSMKEAFNQGSSDPDFLKALANLTAVDDPDFSLKVLQRYFDVEPNKELDKDDIVLLLNGLYTTDSPKYKIFKDKKAEIIKVMPEADYEKYDEGIKINTIGMKAYNSEAKTIDEKYFLDETTKVVGKEKAEELLNMIKANLHK